MPASAEYVCSSATGVVFINEKVLLRPISAGYFADRIRRYKLGR